MSLNFERIERWLEVHSAVSLPLLRPGAGDADIEEAERALGFSLPPSLRWLYKLADEQNDDAPSLLDSFSLMSLAEAIDAAHFLNDDFPDGLNVHNPDHEPMENDPGIQPVWWSSKWMPFMQNGGGDFRCVDLDPAPNGTVGQVLSYYHDETFRSLVAPSVDAMIAMIADGLESGAYGIEAGMITERASPSA